CTSRSCVRASALMLEKMNVNADPCDDFFEFACGRWVREVTPVIATPQWNVIIATGISAISQLAKKLDELLLNSSSMKINSAEEKAVSLYASCIDEERLRELGVRPWLAFVESIGGWAPHERFDVQPLEELLASLYAKSTYPLVWVGSLIDDRNTSTQVITIDEPVPALMYVNLYQSPPLPVTAEGVIDGNCSEFLKALYEMSVYMAVNLLNVESSAELNYSIAEMVEFEWRTVMMSSSLEENRTSKQVYYSTELQTLNNIAPFLNWTVFLGHVYQTEKIDKRERIVIKRGVRWLQRLNAVIQEYQSTARGRRAIESYVKWRAMLIHLQYVTLDFRKQPRGMQLYFERFLFNIAFNEHRTLFCLLRATNLLPIPFASIFRKILPEEEKKNKELVSDISYSIRREFHRQVKEHNEWLEESTKLNVLRKLDNMESLVSYSEQIFLEKAMENEYSELHVDKMDMFWSMVNASRFSRQLLLKRLRQPVERLGWLDNTSPMTINALYNFERNLIILPMMITRPPFADSNMPLLFNYASIGSIIGHEMSHAFDLTGRQHDENGSLRNTWNEQAVKAFDERSQCFIEQYSEFAQRGYPIDANKTLNENVGDNVGLKLAYQAWKSQEAHASFHLPGTNFNGDQAFFVAYAQTWCGKNGEQQKLHPEVHSLDSLRVLGPMQNSDAFAQAFNCPSGSAMNPRRKCAIW
uniref:Uncharacterized protein n=1 Tax=Parascaris univalens TaxID=6257 RepID=A0A915CDW6_PARUN